MSGALEAASKRTGYIHSQAGGLDPLLCRACTERKEAERLSPYRTQETRPKIRAEKHVEPDKGNPGTKRKRHNQEDRCGAAGADEPARHRGRAGGQC